jgi:sphingomyelin phosphodiesterase acid-like 3
VRRFAQTRRYDCRRLPMGRRKRPPPPRRVKGALRILVLAIAWAAVLSAPMPAGAAAVGRALIATDLHFDPMADPALVDRLMAAEPRAWPAILDRTADRSLGHYGADTNWRLLRSALRAMQAALPHPAFVLLPGDFLAHHFRRKFEAAARRHSRADYRAFVQKTMQFLAEEIARAFPGRPIVPALGNNDALCGDYELTPHGRFLAATLPILRRLLGGAGLAQSWTGYGNYEVALPQLRAVRVIVLNTVFFSTHYRDRCGRPGGVDPGQATLAWLERRLAAAKHAGARVWLVYHIPPGADAYATFRSGQCPDAFAPLWKRRYAEAFAALMRRYAGTIAAAFAGHLHMDDFRLFRGGGPGGFVLITPAISPIFDQNPAFRAVSFDEAGGLLDETTYDLTNLTEATAKPGTPAAWKAEYTFTREWHLPRLDAASLARLARRIAPAPRGPRAGTQKTVPAVRRRWEQLYGVSSPVTALALAGFAGSLSRAVRCAPAHLRPRDFDRCYCGAGQGYLVPNRRSPASPSPGRM